MAIFFVIHRRELDFDEEMKSQLDSLAQQTEQTDEQYYYLPQEAYKETFVWVLENNNIPYNLSTTTTYE